MLLGVAVDDDYQELARTLTTAAEPLRDAGLEVATTIRRGEPAEEIVNLGLEYSVDLIVMATHGRTGVGRALLGSVADAVMQGCRLPRHRCRCGTMTRRSGSIPDY
jgi:nucleotide-binding universal stress UspA family protein